MNLFLRVKIEDAISNVVFKNANNFYSLTFRKRCFKKNSPLSFLKKFIVEESEVNKDKFDIKTRALMPLIDGARLFTLSQGLRGLTIRIPALNNWPLTILNIRKYI
jgi:CBS domain-containing protein